MPDLDRLAGNWNYPTAIRFGIGRIAELPDACRELGMANPLLVTDRGLAELAMVGDAAQSCRDAGLGCAVYADVQGNPVEANVNGGVAAFRDYWGDYWGQMKISKCAVVTTAISLHKILIWPQLFIKINEA